MANGEDRNRTYPENTGKATGDAKSGAESGALFGESGESGRELGGNVRPDIDPRLARLIDVWDTLDEATRQTIMAMVEGGG